MITLTESDDGRRLRVGVGDTVEVRLSENATTGYRWEIENLDTDVLQFDESGAEYPRQVAGSSGEAFFRISVHATGSASLRLKCWRPWEGEAGVTKRYAIDVDCR